MVLFDEFRLFFVDRSPERELVNGKRIGISEVMRACVCACMCVCVLVCLYACVKFYLLFSRMSAILSLLSIPRSTKASATNTAALRKCEKKQREEKETANLPRHDLQWIAKVNFGESSSLPLSFSSALKGGGDRCPPGVKCRLFKLFNITLA